MDTRGCRTDSGAMTGAERRGSWLLRAPRVSLGASAAASLRDGEAGTLFNPPQTECSRITPGPLRFLPSDFTLEGCIGVSRLFI